MLHNEISGKLRRAIPLFEQAIANREGKNAETKKLHHQQRPIYIKAMSHIAFCSWRSAWANLIEKQLLNLQKKWQP